MILKRQSVRLLTHGLSNIKLKEQHQSTEELEKLHQLQIEKIQRDGFAKLQEFRDKNQQNIIDARIKEDEENQKRADDFIATAKKATEGALIWSNKWLKDQQDNLEKRKELLLQQLSATDQLVGALGSLGSAIAQNIKDEKQ